MEEAIKLSDEKRKEIKEANKQFYEFVGKNFAICMETYVWANNEKNKRIAEIVERK